MHAHKNGDRLRIALPKCSELEALGDHLNEAGLEVGDVSAPGLHFVEDPFEVGFDFEIFTLAPEDVGTYVEHGICQVGVMGTDVINETEVEVWRPFTFSFGSYPLVLAAPRGQTLESLTSRPALRLATPIPNFTQTWFTDRGINIEVIAVSDSAETAVLLGLADGYVDRLSDPQHLVEQNFSVVEHLGHAYLKLVVNNACGSRRRSALEVLIERLEETQPPAPEPIEIPFEEL